MSFLIQCTYLWLFCFSLTLTSVIITKSSCVCVSATLSQFISHVKSNLLVMTRFRIMILISFSWNKSMILFWIACRFFFLSLNCNQYNAWWYTFCCALYDKIIARCSELNVFNRVFTIFMHTIVFTKLHHKFLICSVMSQTSNIRIRVFV